jgi:hypothetical protein
MRLLALALRRILWVPPTLLGLALIVFTVSHIIPADPARVLAGENAPPEQVEALRKKYGLDQPVAGAVRRATSTDAARRQHGRQPLHPAPRRDRTSVGTPAGHLRAGAVYAIVRWPSRCGIPLGVVSALYAQ